VERAARVSVAIRRNGSVLNGVDFPYYGLRPNPSGPFARQSVAPELSSLIPAVVDELLSRLPSRGPTSTQCPPSSASSLLGSAISTPTPTSSTFDYTSVVNRFMSYFSNFDKPWLTTWAAPSTSGSVTYTWSSITTATLTPFMVSDPVQTITSYGLVRATTALPSTTMSSAQSKIRCQHSVWLALLTLAHAVVILQ
jgi:hypothetical protein